MRMFRALACLLGGTLLAAMPALAQAYTMQALSLYEDGQQYEAAGQWAPAEKAYRESLKADPTLTVAFKAMGTAYYMDGNRGKALECYDQYLASNPNDSATRDFAEKLRIFLAKGNAETPAKDSTGELSRAELVKIDGEVLSGKIEEYHLYDYVRIRTDDGRLYEIQWADILEINGRKASLGVSETQGRRKFWQKGWYLDLFELGFNAPSYPQATQQSLNKLAALSNEQSGDALSINYLGVYWPVGAAKKLLLGFVVDGDADARAGQQLQLNEYIYSLSVRYFPFGKIGDGLYLIGDAGPADVELNGEVQSGFGFQAGIGYAIPAGRLVRPLVSLSYALRSIDTSGEYLAAGNYQAMNLSFGLLW